MGRRFTVGMAEYRMSDNPHDTLCIPGLGSCVGICLYDNKKKIAGLVHILLLQAIPGQKNIFKFADTAIPALLEKMFQAGAGKGEVLAKISGGARMFSGTNSLFDIGKRNVEAVKHTLRSVRVPLRGEDTGGNRGRTITFFVGEGNVEIRTIGGEVRVI